MLLDLLIVLVLAAAVYVGFQRGLLPPLLAEAFFILGLVVLLFGPLSFIPRLVTGVGAVHLAVALALALVAGFLGGRLGRMFQRMPVVRGVDGFFGVFVHGLIAVAVLYVLLSAFVAMDSAFTPLLKQATLGAQQADSLQHALQSNPISAALLSRNEKTKLHTDSRSKGGTTLDSYPQLSQVEATYMGFVRPQLHSSRLAPLILRVGSHIPVVSRLGVRTIPKA